MGPDRHATLALALLGQAGERTGQQLALSLHPQLLTKASHGLRCHPVVVLGTVSLCLALGPLGLWPGVA